MAKATATVTEVSTLERGIVAVKDSNGNRVLLKKFAQVDHGTDAPDFGTYTDVTVFRGKSKDDYMCPLDEWTAPVRATAGEDDLVAAAIKKGIPEDVARELFREAKAIRKSK